jgi:outer membrane protein assembly factor BamE (lipoprotein component of BamABCDE complex)
MKTFLLSAAMLVVLTACNNTTGTKITDAQMNQFKDNQSTLQDVETALGNPTTVEKKSDGTTTIYYHYQNTSIDPTQYIPVVGLATAGAQTNEMAVTTFVFNKNNIMISHAQGTSMNKTNGYLGSTQ